MTYEVALREPGRFRGAAALGGIMFADVRASNWRPPSRT